MPRPAQVSLYVLAGLGVAGGLLWWVLDHRRGAAWAVSVVRDRFPDVPQIPPAGLQHWMNAREDAPPVIVDARSDEEFDISHLPGALHLNVESVDDATLAKLDPQKQYVVYCAAGYRACRLARRMHAAGIPQAANLEGGIFAWANAGLPVWKDGRPVPAVHPYHRLFNRMLKPERRLP